MILNLLWSKFHKLLCPESEPFSASYGRDTIKGNVHIHMLTSVVDSFTVKIPYMEMPGVFPYTCYSSQTIILHIRVS
jgi:hypothetical protein